MGHNGTVLWADLVLEAVGIGLLVAVPLLRPDLVFVEGALGQPGDEQFPDAAEALLHGMVTPVPGIEIPEDRHAHGVRSPEAEHHAADAIPFGDMSTHPFPDVVMVALGKEMAVHLTHPFTPEGPGVVLFMGDAAAKHPNPVVAAGVLAQLGLEHPGVMGRLHRKLLIAQQQGHGLGFRHPDPDDPVTLQGLGAEHREGMIVAAVRQSFAVLNHPVEDCRATHERPEKWARC